MAKYTPANLELTQYENAVLYHAWRILNEIDSWECDQRIAAASDAMNDVVGLWCSDDDDDDMKLNLAHPNPKWENK